MIRVEQRATGIAWITVDRPAARNAMTFAMWERLREAAGELDADPAVKVVVLTGAGDAAFVSGTDIAEFRAFTGGDDGIAYEARMEAVMRALETIRVPTIAAIAGSCTGGGAGIAACCDLRIGAPNARIGVPVARTLGNCLSIANLARVAELVGADAAKAMLLTGRLIDAPEALRCGFLSEIAPAGELLQSRASEVAQAIAELAPLTLRATKTMVRRLRDARVLPSDDDLIRLCYGSRDFREGLTAFLDKRAPEWTGT